MRQPTPEELELLHEELCSALNDKTRMAILYELAQGPRNVSALVANLGQPQGTVSRHLKILRDRHLVHANRDANRVVYQLADARILEVLDLLRKILAGYQSRRRDAATRIRASAPRRPRKGRPAPSPAEENR